MLLSSASALAETLLHEWEQRTQLVRTPAYEAARQPVRDHFTELSKLLLNPSPRSIRLPEGYQRLLEAFELRESLRLACFGLDRIQWLTATGGKICPPADFDAATYFAHCFGITRPTDGQEPQEILLRLAPVQGRYAVSYPLHPSQQVVVETATEICLRLRLYDTHELRMELLSYGPEVEILTPVGLRAWVRETHIASYS